MADHALFFGWGDVIPGREQTAARIFGETMEHFNQLVQEGQITGIEPFFLERHGGELNGFFLIRGERDALAQLRTSEAFDRIVVRAGMVVQRVGVVAASTGGEVQRLMGEFQQAAEELG